MKNTALQISLVIGFVISMAVASAEAQTRYRAHIPFAFSIDQKSYQAGDYTIDWSSPNAANQPIVIRDVNARKSHIIMATFGERYSKVRGATLVFDRCDTQYCLSSISTASFMVKLEPAKGKEIIAGKRDLQPKVVALIH